MAKLFAWEQVQTLWTKIKNTFVAKDSSGNVTVTGSAMVKGSLHLYGDELTSTEVYCDEDGTLVFDGDARFNSSVTMNGVALATVNDVATAVANANHLTREKVTTLPGVSTAKENVIYIVPAGDGSGDDVFDEYMKIEGKLEKIGSSRVDLSGYPTTEEMNTAISNSYTLITDAEIDSLS